MTATALTLALVAGLTSPQAPPNSAGPFVAVAHAISMAPDSYAAKTALDPAKIYFKDVGFATSAPFEWPGGAPDFRVASIFKGVKAPLPDIDGMSIGLDWILADNKGQVGRPVAWGALSFSITPTSKGVAGGIINQEAVATGGAQADLFTYGIPFSDLPPWLVDTVVRAQNDDEVFVRSTVTGKASNIDAHDLFMASYMLGGGFAGVMPKEPRFYFTVSKATLSRVPSTWWGKTKPSGATILVAQWDSKKSVWLAPTVFLQYSDLGLKVEEEMDALSVDEVRKRILFSTTTSTRDPLLIALPVAGVIKVFVYRLLNGPPVSKRLGLLTSDDVDAICSLDPGGGAGARFVPAVLGSPRRQRLLPGTLPSRTSVSAHRARRNRQDVIESYFIGWPAPRQPSKGQAAVAVTIPGPTSPIWVLGFANRNLNPRFAGDPIMFRGNVPPTLQLRGQPILIHWLAVGQNGTDLPHPVLIRL